MNFPKPVNEPVLTYAPGSPERVRLKKRLDEMSKERVEIPCYIGGRAVRTGRTRKVVMPHDHGHVLAEFHLAGPAEIQQAIEASLKAKAEWENLKPEHRAEIFLKAADLLAGPWRETLNAATMLGQSKNAYQAEIDAACELIDFLRFNVAFYADILKVQPISVPGIKNSTDWRPLEGFVAAITPFNFTAIAGNLPAAPAMLGNTVVWKPSDTQMLAAHYTYQLFEKAGLPAGVINMLGAEGPDFGQAVLSHAELAGVHFTGSTPTFQWIWKTAAENLGRYRAYPRLVGETGGKDFVFAHPSADREALTTALIRGAFEYQGQKCSAASRAYIPRSVWSAIQGPLVEQARGLKMGDVRDFRNFVNAVIDERSFKKISGYLDQARADSSKVKVLAGGRGDSKRGYFIEPTLLETTDPKYRTMTDELFGPVLSLYVYDDARVEEALQLCESSSAYGLTGAVFSQDRAELDRMSRVLRHAAGNFYLNDKPTGAVVAQQPFGGGRASGTNDKAGSPLNLYRWFSPRTIKETLEPPKDYRYPFLAEE